VSEWAYDPADNLGLDRLEVSYRLCNRFCGRPDDRLVGCPGDRLFGHCVGRAGVWDG
jgi:hypothetical protein